MKAVPGSWNGRSRSAREAGFLGKNILGSGFSFEIARPPQRGPLYLRRGHGPDQCHRGKEAPSHLAAATSPRKGLWGHPTVINNVETLACVPHILRNGAEWFRSLAKTRTGAGTKLYCVSGRVNRPGCFELPMGTR